MNSYNKNYLDKLAKGKGFLRNFLQFSEAETSFVEAFNKREYRPEMLFGDGEMAQRVSNHPMALWKCRAKD